MQKTNLSPPACERKNKNFSGQKERVRLCWTGCMPPPIHRRYPTTARRGAFCLLCFHPGPVRPSLDDLVRLGSPGPTISTPGLAWTPDRHRAATSRTPALKPSMFPTSKAVGLQDCTTSPSLLHQPWNFYSTQQLVLVAVRSLCVTTCTNQAPAKVTLCWLLVSFLYCAIKVPIVLTFVAVT